MYGNFSGVTGIKKPEDQKGVRVLNLVGRWELNLPRKYMINKYILMPNKHEYYNQYYEKKKSP